MILDNLVFRLEHYKSDSWDLGNDCFLFYKIEPLVEQYARFFQLHSDFHPQTIFELGIWDGGSIAFWNECFGPDKHVAIDLQQRTNSAYFEKYVTARHLQERIRTYWGIDQNDASSLQGIVARDFPGGQIDLIFDDASHSYDATKSSFEALFPYVSPGGFYIIEDWAWAHWSEFQGSDDPWTLQTALTQLVFELVEATGSRRTEDPALIYNVTVYQGFAAVQRGSLNNLDVQTFRLEKYISRRPAPRIPKQPSRVRRLLRRVKRKLIGERGPSK